MTTLAIDPHGDDLALFAAFTVQQTKPDLIVVCFDSYVQTARGVLGCDALTRIGETQAAMNQLFLYEIHPIEFLNLRDDGPAELALVRSALWKFYHQFDHIIHPAYEAGGHDQHNAVALACREIFNGAEKRTEYLTYTRQDGKSRNGTEVLPPSAEAISRKLAALSRFKSQMQLDPRLGTADWFYKFDFREYVL